MTRAVFVAACLGGLLGGGLAGWMSVPGPLRATARTVPPTNVTEPAPEATGDQAACAEKVAQALADIDALRRGAYGDPEPFPDDLDPAYMPAAVEARARSVATACPELGMQLLKVDCAEFPCVTLWSRTDGNTENPLARLDTCPAWSVVDRDDKVGNSAGAGWKGPGGELISVALVATYPPGWSETHAPSRDPQIRKPRFEVRKEAIFGDLQAELGARDLTKVEQMELMVEHARASDEGDEALQFWLDKLQEARAAEASAAAP